MTSQQLPLALGLKDSAVFANFVIGPNERAVSFLRALKGGRQEPAVYIWGKSGAGKSHLLQALCHGAGERNLASVYLPMRIALDFPRDALKGLESVALVCIDDVQLLAASEEWQQAIIALFERVHDSGASLVVAADSVPSECGLMPALASRLAWGMAFQIKRMAEDETLAALRLRAERRGLVLGADAARYLVRHLGHDMTQLFDSLDRLDQASLVAKRKLTIPFIRQTLAP